MNTSLAGKVALVTGASLGLGAGIAKSFIEAGAHVFGTGRNQAALDAAAKTFGKQFTPFRCDSTNEIDLDNLMERIKEDAGRLDIVVTNAGYSENAALGSISAAHIESVLGVNIKGTVFTAQKALPLMPDGSCLLLMSSTMAFRGFPAISIYSASKAGVRALARGWVVELKPRKIRVNVITPGPIETEGMHKMMPTEEETKKFMDWLAGTVPLGRLGQPEDIGNLAVFLASPAGGFINGADIQIDGGASQI